MSNAGQEEQNPLLDPFDVDGMDLTSENMQGAAALRGKVDVQLAFA